MPAIKNLKNKNPYIVVALLTVVFGLAYSLQFDKLYLGLIGIAILVIFTEVLLFHKSIILQFLILSIPFSQKFELGSSGFALSLPSEGLLLVLSIIYLLIIVLKGEINTEVFYHPISKAWLLLFGWLAFSTVFSQIPLVSFKRLFVYFLFYLIYFFALAQTFKDLKNIKKVYWLYLIGLTPVILSILYMHSKWSFIVQIAFTICEPWFAEHTVYGACLAFIFLITSIFILKSKTLQVSHFKKIALILSLIVVGIGLYFSFSRAAWLSVFASGFLWFLMHYFKVSIKQISWTVLFLSVSFFLFNEKIMDLAKENKAVSNKGDLSNQIQSVTNVSNDASNLERLNRWKCALRMFTDKPIVGFGLGTYQFEYGSYQKLEELTHISTFKGDKGNAHSEYLGILSEAGLPGLLLFLGLIFKIYKTAFNLFYQSENQKNKYMVLALILGLNSFFFHGIFNAFIDQDEMASLIFSACAGLVVLDINFKKNKNELVDTDNSRIV